MTVQSSLGPIRPPSEASSLLIRVTKNCSWNRCTFCCVFKGQKFEIRPVEEVKDDIQSARRWFDELCEWAKQTGYSIDDVARLNGIRWVQDGVVKSAFLQDSDSLIIKTDQMVEIVEYLYENFSTLERICSYARGKTIFRKTPAELARLREAGISRLHIGLETGDDELLKYIQKGATSEEMIQAGRNAVEAGFEVSEYVMPGLGGREKWKQHAENTARVLNEINPCFIRLRALHLIPGTELHERAARGEFHVHTIESVLLEIRQFVELLNVTSRLVTGDYAWNAFMSEIDGTFPEDKEKVLNGIDRALAHWRARGEPKRNPFAGNIGTI